MRPIATHARRVVPRVAGKPAEPVRSMAELMRRIAALEFKHAGACLYFRGQTEDWGFSQKLSSPSVLIPSIYRADNGGFRSTEQVIESFDLLQCMDSVLLDRLLSSRSDQVAGERARQLQRALVRWSIIQHYELCRGIRTPRGVGTPLLDVTQDLDAACAFALCAGGAAVGQTKAEEPTATQPTVYVLALPYPTAGISTHPEEAMTNVRLLSVCPPEAKRPRYQAAFAVLPELIEPDLAGLALEASAASELDFSSRLIGKFRLCLPTAESDRLRESHVGLFPADDQIARMAEELKSDAIEKFEEFREPLHLIAGLLARVLDLRKRHMLASAHQAVATSSGISSQELVHFVRGFDSDRRTACWINDGLAEVVARALRFRSEVIAFWRRGDGRNPPRFNVDYTGVDPRRQIQDALDQLGEVLERMRKREPAHDSRRAA